MAYESGAGDLGKLNMRMILVTLAAALAVTAAGCATEPPPCTSEWVQWKKDRVLKAFASEHRKEINALRNMAEALSDDEGDKSPVMLTISMAAVGGLALAADFIEEAAPAVRQAIGQCGSAPKAAQLFADMLRQEGVDEKAVRAIEGLVAALPEDAVPGASK